MILLRVGRFTVRKHRRIDAYGVYTDGFPCATKWLPTLTQAIRYAQQQAKTPPPT